MPDVKIAILIGDVCLWCWCPGLLGALAIGEMVEVGDNRETVIRECLVSMLDEAEGHFPDKGCPAAVGAPRTEYAVTEGEGIEIEDVARRLFAETVAMASLEDAHVKGLIAADEEGDTLMLVNRLYAQHHLVEFL